MGNVGIIGAGPAGIAAARYLISEGFEPVLFEATGAIGGQWSGNPEISGIWPGLRTNTSRVLTAFSDMPLGPGVVHPPNQELRKYLERYADHFGVTKRVRLNTPVLEVRQSDTGWIIEHAGGEQHVERVLIAAGRFHHPQIPDVTGLDSFAGSEGFDSTYNYNDPEQFRDKRVLIAGCGVSALEIASDLAMLGAACVVVTHRRQRYVLPKYAQGVASDHRIFTRYGVFANESLPLEEVGRQLKEIVVEAGGTPGQYGAPDADEEFFKASVTLSQYYLPLVGEGRIHVRPWIDRVDGETVHFTDGSEESFDAILFGTGFEIDLPMLSDAIRSTIDLDEQHMDLYRHTFHPNLPGLAFLGMWDQSGGYLVPIELQARWVAYAWSGAIPAPTQAELVDGIAAYRAQRGQSQKTRMNLVALEFARAAGVEPDLARHPELARALLFGPLAPSSFRIDGHDPLPDAAERFVADAAMYGAITTETFSPRELVYLGQLAEARDDDTLRAIVTAAQA